MNMTTSALSLSLFFLAAAGSREPTPDVIPPDMRSIAVERSVDLKQLRDRCCVHYVVKKGDSLSRIAERELGSTRRSADIAALNPGLQPRIMQPGARIWLPARDASAPLRFLYLVQWGPWQDVAPFATTDTYPTYWAMKWGFVVVDEAHQAALLERTVPKQGARGRRHVEQTVLHMAAQEELQFAPVETTSALVKKGSPIARKTERVQVLCDTDGRVSTNCEIRCLDKEGRELEGAAREQAPREQSWLLLVGAVGAGLLMLRRRRRSAGASAPATA